ncbi:NAD(P)-dependent oxidoreductase [Phaeovulum sp. W22_SRMD_FR3]|uniref:NAD(P)-dependent oxidoreductase n=1 Tax=Phaeovulum sp. W22_SRMD_FR3 TaxID=3240274 RepID=UPI003F99FF70
MKCLIVQPVHADGLALLRANGVEAVLCPDPTDASILPRIGACEAVITRDAGLSAAAIAAGKRLRVVVVHGAGHDAVDKEAATRQGVLVCNTPGANARSVVELALGLALAAARRIPAGDRAVRAGQHGFREAFPTFELSGKTALIVGWGTIGAGLGRILRDAFGMRVLIYSPHAPLVEGYERVTDLTQGLAKADLISLHTPLRPQTRGLIGAAALSACKPGAILVNTARAGLVDEAALAAALANGQIAAAALDVYSPEAPQGPLAAFAQVIFTPHQGGATREALSRVALGSVGHVLTALAGQIPETALNSPPGWPGQATSA